MNCVIIYVFISGRLASSCTSSCGGFGNSPISGLKHFIPALHHALNRSHTNPSSELATGVELQAQEYLVGQKDGKVLLNHLANAGAHLTSR